MLVYLKIIDITMSSTKAKMVEMLLIPGSVISNTKLRFRATRGTSFGCALLNDVIAYFQEQSSPVYICALYSVKLNDLDLLCFHRAG